MKVRELIAALNELDPELEVEYEGDDMYDSYPAKWVEVEHGKAIIR